MRFLTYEGLDPGDLSDAVAKVAAAIERDDLRTPDVKKLHVGDYYRARLDSASRLLLQFVRWREERACLALEVIRNHDYARSRFLRGAPVDESKLLEPAAPETVTAAPIRYLHPTRTRFHLLDKPLSFDDTQDALLRARPPAVIVGSAGSGKTALMLQKLRAQPGRVAYVSESSWLTRTARSLYVAHDWDPGEQEADFLSYTQLLESIRVPPGRPLGFREFRAFFERHAQKLRFASAHPVFEELRGVLTADPAGPLTLEQYLALGVRQSIFSPEQREQIHALIAPWRQWMESSGIYEPNLCAHAWLSLVEPRYDFVAVDEVQDLTPVQLTLILRTLKKPGQFILGGDANQIVHPNFFSWSKVKSLFWQGFGGDELGGLGILSASYRNSEAVTRVANALLKIKQARFGSIDRESNTLMRAEGAPAGEVRGVKTGSPQVAELSQATRGSAQVAVVVLRDEDKPAARAAFQTPLVFSIHEAKGLEYPHVVLYRLVSSERRTFAELCEGVTASDLERESLDYARARDKSDRSLEAFKFYVNALYVGITRAVENAWLVEDDPEHPLLIHLKVPFDAQAKTASLTRSSVEEWQREAHRLEEQGKLEQAEAIRSTVLRHAPVPWTPLAMPALEALANKALDPGCVSSKARTQLFEYSCFHGDAPLANQLVEAGFEPARQFDTQRLAIAARQLHGYEGKAFKEVLTLADRHGVDFRTPMNLTPLMVAAYAWNLPLVEALIARGARVEARDHLGMTAMHWCLRRAWDVPASAIAGSAFGAVYDSVAPAAFEVQVGNRLLQIGREHGEFILFHLLLASWGRRFGKYGRHAGFSARELFATAFPGFPEVVVRHSRRERTYVNHVLSRSEAGSSYPTSRRLWIRERQGHYAPNPELQLRVQQEDGSSAWLPVQEVLAIDWLQRHQDRWGRRMGRATTG